MATTTPMSEKPTAHLSYSGRLAATLRSGESSPCNKLSVLDVEVGQDGEPKGAWLSDPLNGPTLVLVGERFGESVLTRVAITRDAELPTVWLRTGEAVCQTSPARSVDVRPTVQAESEVSRATRTSETAPGSASQPRVIPASPLVLLPAIVEKLRHLRALRGDASVDASVDGEEAAADAAAP